MPHKNDIIILKSLNITGFVCQRGYRCIFDKMDGYYYICNPGEIKVQKHQILQIIDSLTYEVIYQDNLEDGL